MFFDTAPANKSKNKNVSLTRTQLPKPKEVELIFPHELQGSPTEILDVECYPNYFMCGFKFLEENKYAFYENYQGIWSCNGEIIPFETWRDSLSYALHRFLNVGFNSIYYDLPLLFAAIRGKACEELKALSNEIIGERKRIYRTDRINHIDIMEVAPLHDGLKTYAGRIHAPRMQELPYEHYKPLTEEQVYYVRSYNVNDLDNTGLLYGELKGQIRLREKLGKRYSLDLRSKSDAQVAEAVIQSELSKIGVRARAPSSIAPGTTFFYKIPDFIQFRTGQLQHVLNVVRKTEFTIGADGSANTPANIRKLKIRIGNTDYQMGNGGLHSKEQSVSYFTDENQMLVDCDVSQYYPSILLNQQLYPTHLGPEFCDIYKNLIEMRKDFKIKIKKYKLDGDLETSKYWDEESSSIKIAANGTFGKFGNKYSIVYSPQLVTQITMSGQLFLLMLIEELVEHKFNVISANTDGILTVVPTDRKAEFDAISKSWEKHLNFELEQTLFKSLHMRDVNNFVHVKLNGEIKEKGIYSKNGSALNSPLSKNPETRICVEALEAFLLNGTPIAETINACKDITKFVSVKKVEGGAQKEGQYLGKVIRWYYAKEETGTINYVTTGNTVGKTEGAKPLMDLPDQFPNDIDYGYYESTALSMLYDIGYYKKAKAGDMFR